MPDQPPEFARDIVILALGEDAPGNAEPGAQRLVVGPLFERVGGGRRCGEPLPVRGCACRRTRRSYARRSVRAAASAASDSRASAAARACPRAAERPDRGRLGDSSGCRGSRGHGKGPADLPSRVSAALAAAAHDGGRSVRGISSGRVYPGARAVRRRIRTSEADSARSRYLSRRGYSAATASRLRRFGTADMGAATLPFARTASSVVRISASFCGCSTLWPNRFLT